MHEKCLYHPINFFVNLKLLLKDNILTDKTNKTSILLFHSQNHLVIPLGLLSSPQFHTQAALLVISSEVMIHVTS